MTTIHSLSKSRGTATGDVVFVHGLGGDPFNTWRLNTDGSWSTWLAADRPDLSLWSLGYDVEPTAWTGRAMPLVDRAINVLAVLDGAGVGAQPLCFVTHSMGGLLVKQLLRHASTMAREYQHICTRTRGVIFFSTPHAGSSVASLASYLQFLLRATVAVKELEAHEPHLRELNLWYRNNVAALDIATRVFYETIETQGVMVVTATSADPGLAGVTPIPVDSNHYEVCCPKSRDDLRYVQTLRFLNERLPLIVETVSEALPDRIPVKTHVISEGGAVWPNYEIGRELYSEPLSRLQQVTNRLDGKPYLLKTIRRKAGYYPEVVEHIRRAYARTKLGPRVAIPIELREDRHHFYELLPYFNGWTLYELVHNSRFRVYGALLEEWAKDLLAIVSVLHTNRPRIVHRDISPYNVLVLAETLNLALLDFSSAILAEGLETYEPIACPGFSSPEQMAGEATTTSDVYSMGALLYYMNSGEWPPTAEDRLYRGNDVELREEMRDRLKTTIYRMLSLATEDRFQDAASALQDIRHRQTTELIGLPPIATLPLPDGSKIEMGRNFWRRIHAA